MSNLPEKIARIRREIDPEDAQSLSYFGVSAQRRLTSLASLIAAQDSVAIVAETDDTLADVIALLTHKPTRWLDPILRVLAILPIKTPEQRYIALQRRLQVHLSRLQQQRAQFKVWRSDLDDVVRDLKNHITAGQTAILEIPSGHGTFIDSLRLRLQDLTSSQQIASLVRESLEQRQANYRLLIEQLQVVMGSGAAAWHAFRGQLQATGPAGFAKMRELAEACKELPWQALDQENL